jgi:hypothetical protein
MPLRVEHVQSMMSVKSHVHDVAPSKVLGAAIRTSRMSKLVKTLHRKPNCVARVDDVLSQFGEFMRQDSPGRQGSLDNQARANRRNRHALAIAFKPPSRNKGGFDRASTGMFIRQTNPEIVMPMDAEEIQCER